LVIKRSLNIEIGGLCAEVRTESEYAFSFLRTDFKDFVSEKTPDFSLEAIKKPFSLELDKSTFSNSKEDVISEIKVIKRDSGFAVIAEIIFANTTIPFETGVINLEKKQCRFNDETEALTRRLLTAFLRSSFQFFLSKRKGLLIHSCAVIKNDSAYIFAGPSGSGKSTIGRLSNGLTVLSDEFVCIRANNDSYCAYGTPWDGNDKDTYAEIKRIFFLKQDKITEFKTLTPAFASGEILSNIYHNTLNKGVLADVLNTIIELTSKIPCYRMHFSLERPLWEQINNLESERLKWVPLNL